MNKATCRGCGAPIVWIKTPAGKAMPCDPAPVYYKATPDGKDKVVTTRGELVVDFFGGSGSTLIACENTGRTCAMIELEPKWCDVIVRRYIKTTGDNNVRCVRQGRELSREEIAGIFDPDEEGGGQE